MSDASETTTERGRVLRLKCAECNGCGSAWRDEVHGYEPCPACLDGMQEHVAGPGLFCWLAGAKSLPDLLVRLGASIESADTAAGRAREMGCRDSETVALVEAAALEAARDALAAVLGTHGVVAMLPRSKKKPGDARLFRCG